MPLDYRDLELTIIRYVEFKDIKMFSVSSSKIAANNPMLISSSSQSQLQYFQSLSSFCSQSNFGTHQLILPFHF